MDLEDKIDALPTTPGVYIMKGRGRVILYIGKAKNLRARVRSYFRTKGDGRYSVRYLVRKVEDIDFIVTANEKEALILEDTLLKKHRPRYNIRLKDDKTYVSIKLTMQDDFPRILVTRQIKADGSRYFGPYASSRGVRETIKFLRKIFPLRICSNHEFRNRVRPCIDYSLGLCSAPAEDLITKEDYAELVRQAVLFLEGKNRSLVNTLRRKMKSAAATREYEKAADLRDRIEAIEGLLEEQKVVSSTGVDQDIFGLVAEDERISIVLMSVRDGRLTGTRDFLFPDSAGVLIEDVVSSFLGQLYRRIESFIPNEVLLPITLPDAGVIAEWLSDRKGRKVFVRRPVRGKKLKLVKMAEENARESLKKVELSIDEAPLEELKRRLRLTRLPRVIEAFDISNLAGSEAVGAMAVLKNGKPDNKNYRVFKIKTIDGPNDYAMMCELLSRRYGRCDESSLPDLILIDGGKGQLGIALDVLNTLQITGVDVAALAKEKPVSNNATGAEKLLAEKKTKGERVFRPGVKDPVLLKEGSKGDLLLRLVRDEVHRFAIRYHRKLRSKKIGSVLETVSGVGAKKRKMLFEHFVDLDGIKNASIGELCELPGITEKLAKAIKDVAG